MRSRISPHLLRVAFALSIVVLMAFGPIGCDGGSAPPTGTTTQLPPEAEKANKSMEDYVKSQQKK